MYLSELRLTNFRNLEHAQLDGEPGIHWLYGENGAGKTSVLESLYVLARGRSFRSNNIHHLVRDGAPQLNVFARTEAPAARLGMARSRSGWAGKINGEATHRVSEFAKRLPVVLVEPTHHELIEGGPDRRRAFMDWGMFHVKHGYLSTTRRYNRYLQQRNAALKQRAPNATLDALEAPMAELANAVDEARTHYVDRLVGHTQQLQLDLDWRFAAIDLRYSRAEPVDYGQIWRAQRDRDRELGYTREGTHRADLKIVANGRLAAPRLSRGQQKLTALLLLLGQLLVAQEAERLPLLLLDDPVSELDQAHLERILAWVQCLPNQVWITAVAPPPHTVAQLFHVKHGAITPG
ncbi:MAG: DNA replication/repair protein RecF [Pseudomonadota bacterium]